MIAPLVSRAKKLQDEIQLKVAELKKKKKMERKAVTVTEQKDHELQAAILRFVSRRRLLLLRTLSAMSPWQDIK